MIRLGAALLAAAIVALWFAMPDAEARRRHHRVKREVPAAMRAIDVGPKVVRTIRIDPCEVARTFVEMWRCRAP